MSEKRVKNRLLFPLIMVSMAAIMYCIAFHEERDKNKELQRKIELLESKKK